jgi:AraC-like DNA-binding protein
MAVAQWVTSDPASGLRPYVGRYVGYRFLGQPPGLHRGLPSQNMTLIFSIGPEIDIASQTNRSLAPRSYRAVLAGLHDTPALVAHDGNQEGVSVLLSPLGARTLLGHPASELWHLSLEADEVVGRNGLQLSERLHETDDWDERFAACDQVLTRLLGHRTVAPELAEAWRILVRSGGRVPVADVAAEVGYTRQYLRHRFTQEFGLGPKRAARLIRFDRACGMLLKSPPLLSIAQIAVAAGYYDQAHLHRDFAELAGCTPVELAAGDIPIVQDEPATA